MSKELGVAVKERIGQVTDRMNSLNDKLDTATSIVNDLETRLVPVLTQPTVGSPEVGKVSVFNIVSTRLI